MKRTLLYAAAVLALAACSKEEPLLVEEEASIDASRIVFNIKVENGHESKGVKTAWETGDVVYAFFEDNSTQYVKMTYDGTSWAYSDNAGGTAFTGLDLTASGKKVSAVYFPGFVCSSAPTYDESQKWTFGTVGGYYQTTVSDYTVTSVGDVSSLSATLRLEALPGISQLYIPSNEFAAPDAGEEYVLTAPHFIPFLFDGIKPGEAATFTTADNGFPMTGYDGSIGGEAGLYFWGILEGAGTYDFSFQLVKRDAQRKFAVSSYSKTAAGKTVGESVAFKIGGFTDNGNFVSLGYAGGPLWATGNLNKTNKKIVYPLDAGEYFMYGKTTPYNSSDGIFGGTQIPLPVEYDAAYSANSAWRIPSEDQFLSLVSGTNTSNTWVEGWSNVNPARGGRLLTSKVNGISLYFATTGFYLDGVLNFGDSIGYYWTCTPFYLNAGERNPFYNGLPGSPPYIGSFMVYVNYAFIFRLDGDEISMSKDNWLERFMGLQVRPVKN